MNDRFFFFRDEKTSISLSRNIGRLKYNSTITKLRSKSCEVFIKNQNSSFELLRNLAVFYILLEIRGGVKKKWYFFGRKLWSGLGPHHPKVPLFFDAAPNF